MGGVSPLLTSKGDTVTNQLRGGGKKFKITVELP